jgi:hypothetical protein
MPSLVIYGSILTDCLGSQYFDVHHNMFLYGTGGLKSDYGGHDNKYVDVITRTSHYESFTVSGTGYNVCVDNRHHENVYAWLAHGKAVSVEARAHASRPMRCW